MPQLLYPREGAPVPTEKVAGWVPERFAQGKNLLSLSGYEPNR